MAGQGLKKDELDTFAEVCNIIFGAPANELTGRLKGQVKFAPPKVREISSAQGKEILKEKIILLKYQYSGAYQGAWIFFIDLDTGRKIASRMLDKQLDFDIDTLPQNALNAVKSMMNEIMSLVQGAGMQTLGKELSFRQGIIEVVGQGTGNFDFAKIFPNGMLEINFRFKVADTVDSTLLSFVDTSFAKSAIVDFEQAVMQQMDNFDADKLVAVKEDGINFYQRFAKFGRIDGLLVQIAIELASTKLKFKDLWGMDSGSLLKFKRHSTGQVKVKFGKGIVALGDVVRIGEHFGVKIREVKQ
ncbi:MAG: hypothetical protein DRP78_02575 [Candidatus Omnitrophota bacterium]|nr:MAG: hypothetical protein DRP78_02575 [Candidatus Omnitrophota bacterium]